MRFAARLAIALAALISSAILCWGQPPAPGGQPVMISDSAAPASRGAIPQAPAALEGAWVSDAEQIAAPEATYGGPQGGAVDGAAAAEEYGEECADDCDEYAALGCGGFFRRKPFLDMWGDVHAHRRIYAQADYLNWWAKGNRLPPLVTTSPPGTPQSQAGVLPESATTAILFGNERVDKDRTDGGRINLGYWLVDGEFWGIEGQYFALRQQHQDFNARSNFTDNPDAQILARPFINFDPAVFGPVEAAAIVAFPGGFIIPTPIGPAVGTLDGAINIQTTSNLQGADALLRKLVWVDFTACCRLDFVIGYRFLRLDDSVTINDESTFTPTSGPLATTVFVSQDFFGAKNQFHGGELGIKGQKYYGRFSIDVLAKVAFGNNHQHVSINGFNTLTTLGDTTTNTGGLLTQTSNIGEYKQDVFAILPEGDVNFRYDLTRNLRATFGYSFLYINRVQRSGDAIDRGLNPTQINGGTLVGDARPGFAFHNDTYYVHGFNSGFEYRW